MYGDLSFDMNYLYSTQIAIIEIRKIHRKIGESENRFCLSLAFFA